MEIYKSFNFLNEINRQTCVLIKCLDHIFKYINITNKTTTSQCIFLLLDLIYINTEKEDDNKQEEKKLRAYPKIIFL